MKKLISLFLIIILILTLVSCGRETEEGAVSLSVLCVNTDYSRNFVETIHKHFPEVDLQVEYYAGANNPSGYIKRLVESGNSTDIVYSGTLLEEDLQKKYLLDLSAYDFADQYSVSIMNRRDVDGALYMLPGTYSVFSMLYNKSLFEEKEWTVPTTNDEFVALCRQIREETDIIPVAHTGFAVGTYWRMLGAVAQSGFLGTSEGAEWTKAFVKGDESFESGFGDAINIMKEWKDAGVLDRSDMNCDIIGSYEKLLSREAAMAYPIGGLATLGKVMAENNDQIGAFPFLGETKDRGILTTSMNFNFGLSKALGKAGNEKRLEKALEIMAFLSSAEGQKELAVLDTDVSPLGQKEPPAENTPYDDVWELIESGESLPYLYEDYYDIWVPCAIELQKALFGDGSFDTIAADMDELHRQALADQDAIQPMAVVEEDMTHVQTLQTMADLLYQIGTDPDVDVAVGAGAGAGDAGVDVAVVSDGTFINGVANNMGVSGRLFAGDIYSDEYNINIPGSANKNLMCLNLTGEELFALLEGGHSVTDGSHSLTDGSGTAVFDYYWSGIDAEMTDGKIVSAVLSDGSAVEKDGSYRVLICAGDYDAAAYPNGEDTGVIISDAYRAVMDGKTIGIPGKICR